LIIKKALFFEGPTPKTKDKGVPDIDREMMNRKRMRIGH